MTTQQIADRFYELASHGKEAEIHTELYSDDIVSIEMPGAGLERCEGKEELKKKLDWWEENFELHSGSNSEPLVADDCFAVRWEMDVTHKPSGMRSTSSEIGVYRVADGKIVHEQYFYSPSLEG